MKNWLFSNNFRKNVVESSADCSASLSIKMPLKMGMDASMWVKFDALLKESHLQVKMSI